MKIKYLAVFDGNPESGVSKKLFSQVEALNSNSASADLVLLARKKLDTPHPHIEYFEVKSPPYKNFFEKISFLYGVAKAIEKFSGECDVLYFRGLLPSPFLLISLKKTRRAKVVFEIQSIEEMEARMTRAWGRYWMTRFFSGPVLRNCDGIVGVTKEITGHYRDWGGALENFSCTVGNGISVRNIPLRTCPDFDGNQLDLLCVANLSRWHGVDRIIKGMAKFREKKIMLHIAGDGAGMPELKKLAADHGLDERVIFHGIRSGRDLDDMFDRCHLAVGSLAIHRKGSNETSELKTREYCARGIPFICSAVDNDFLPDFSYRLKIPADEEPVGFDEIFRFAGSALGDRNHPTVMRDHALLHLDWTVKMKRLAGFFSKILERKTEPGK